MRSAFVTSRTVVRERSRSMPFMATRLRASRSTSSNTPSPGSGMSNRLRASGASRRCDGRMRSSHQVTTSGNESSRRVSPVGAQSTTTQSNSPSSWWRLIHRSENSSSMPGGTVSSSAEIRSTPRSSSSEPSQPCTESQWRSISSCAWTSWPNRFAPACVGSGPSSASSESDRLWAGSVESTTVRRPAAAQRLPLDRRQLRELEADRRRLVLDRALGAGVDQLGRVHLVAAVALGVVAVERPQAARAHRGEELAQQLVVVARGLVPPVRVERPVADVRQRHLGERLGLALLEQARRPRVSGQLAEVVQPDQRLQEAGEDV